MTDDHSDLPPPGVPPGPPPPPTPTGQISGTTWLGFAAVVALAVAVSLEEDGDNGWGRIGVWAAFAIAAALATLAPAVREPLRLTPARAAQVAVAGGIGLAAFWVLFVLPVIERNVSFLATLGCVAGCWAAWRAPGRPGAAGPAPGRRPGPGGQAPPAW